MNTNQIQRFASTARNLLIEGVSAKLNLLGFNADGQVAESDRPRRYSDSTVFQGRVIPGTRFYEQWNELYNRIQLIGRDDVCEEAAYTWFNRLMALRILQENGIIQYIVDYESPSLRVPRIVTDARRGRAEYLQPSDIQQLNEILSNDARVFDQFQILITAFCHNHPILKACFGGITGYTELLLPNNILVDGNFIDLLNNTTYINTDDYRHSELIGWLYQFYISEKKDQVFASFKDGKKAEADQIPAATQIFTPNWIVKYMVQNTLGRIYLDNYPNSFMRNTFEYLVEQPPVESTQARKDDSTRTEQLSTLNSKLSTLKCADLSCGSGHILGELFEMLYRIYDEELYEPRQAIESILQNNIIGIDIDTRAKQLSMFALLLKACQYDLSFADAHCLPRVLDMPNCNRYTWLDLEGHMVTALQIKSGTEKIAHELEECFLLLEQARNLGSIMKFNISPETRAFMQECLAQQAIQQQYVEEFKPLFDGFELILALTDKYAAIVMNPPYMGSGNMNAELSQYVRENYEDEKSDLFAVFMQVAEDHLLPNAKYGMINMQSWMFLSSFEKLRTHVIDDMQIDSMLHLGPRTFDELSGEVVQNTAFVFTNTKPFRKNYYFRLVDFAPSDLKKDNFKNCCRHIRYNGDISKMQINLSPYCFCTDQSNFKKIPGSPVGYWVSEKTIELFKGTVIGHGSIARSGFSTGDNNKYIRLWHEVSNNDICFNSKTISHYYNTRLKYIPYTAGGSFRKWYGNLSCVINWTDTSAMHRPRTTYSNLYCKEGATWNEVTTDAFSCRYYPYGLLFEHSGVSLFPNESDQLYYYIGLLNSKIVPFYLKLLNPTLHNGAEVVAKIPFIFNQNNDITDLVKQNIFIGKEDWDAHETSWDFEENELIRMQYNCTNNAVHFAIFPLSPAELEDEGIRNIGQDPRRIDHCMQCYQVKWMRRFGRLHRNEEKLNEQFIEIYGLKDEISPKVHLNEVTILQQGELTIPTPTEWKPDEISCIDASYFNQDNIIQQFISYAVGCFMGRYRLDRPGLHIAHPNPTTEELAPYKVPDFPYPVLSQDLVDEFVLDVYDQDEMTDDIFKPLDSNIINRFESTRAHKFESTRASFTIDDDGIIPILPVDAPFPDNATNRITDFVKYVFGTDFINENMNFIQNALGESVADYMSKHFYADHKKRYQNRPIYWLFSSKKGAFQCLVYMHRMNRFTIGRIRDSYLLPYIQHLEAKQADYELRAALLSTAERREQKRTVAILQECREYDNILHLFADRQIEINLDDGVLHNYNIFKDILAKLK